MSANGVLCHEHRRSTRRRATAPEMKEGPSGSAIRSSKQRNTAGARIKWMFTTEKARAKMGRAYPVTPKESYSRAEVLV
jgi:hypothetical protein